MNELNRYCPVCRGIMIDDLDFPDRAVYKCVRCHRRFTFSMFTKLHNLGNRPTPPPPPHLKRSRPLVTFFAVFLIVFFAFFILAILL